MDFDIYRNFRPDIIVLSEISWYVLDKIETFLEFLEKEMNHVYVIHLLTIYPKTQQKYGKEYFTDLKGILKYFKMNYLEFGEIVRHDLHNCKRTYFVGITNQEKSK